MTGDEIYSVGSIFNVDYLRNENHSIWIGWAEDDTQKGWDHVISLILFFFLLGAFENFDLSSNGNST